MKNEAEIRKHIRDLEAHGRSPCLCGSFQCYVDRRMALASAEALKWVLDQNSDYDRLVENAAAFAAR